MRAAVSRAAGRSPRPASDAGKPRASAARGGQTETGRGPRADRPERPSADAHQRGELYRRRSNMYVLTKHLPFNLTLYSVGKKHTFFFQTERLIVAIVFISFKKKLQTSVKARIVYPYLTEIHDSSTTYP